MKTPFERSSLSYEAIRDSFLAMWHSLLVRLGLVSDRSDTPSVAAVTGTTAFPRDDVFSGTRERRTVRQWWQDLSRENPYVRDLLVAFGIVALILTVLFGWDQYQYRQRLAVAMEHPMTTATFMNRAFCGWTDCSEAQARFQHVSVSGTVRYVADKVGGSVLIELGSPEDPQVYDVFYVLYLLENDGASFPEEGDLIGFTWRDTPCSNTPFWAAEDGSAYLCYGVMPR